LEIEHDTGINTGIPVVVFSNTEIPVLPNVVGIGGPNCQCIFWVCCLWPMLVLLG